MKMAVIIGVLHMTKGIIIKGINAIYFRDWLVLFFEVITGIIILGGLFGWMDVLIFGKWFNEYEAYNFLIPSSYSSDPDVAASATESEQATYEFEFNKLTNAPSIYNIMISNFLKSGVSPA
jgi:hypothetical protein